MTTATVTDPTAPVETPAPVEPEIASIFYPSADPVPTPAPTDSSASPPASEPGPSATPPAASAVSTEPVKPTESPVGTETKEPKPEEKGHAAAARRLGAEVADLKRELQGATDELRVLKAKADGTYQEPVQPTPQEIAERAEFKGRETSSRVVAEGVYGATVIQAQVYEEGSPYKTLVSEKPWLHARVARSPQPTVEAMRVLKEQEFLKMYGEDPAQWVPKIEAELRPRILEEFKKQTATPVTGAPAPSVTEARGSGGLPREQTLEQLFYGKTTPSA